MVTGQFVLMCFNGDAARGPASALAVDERAYLAVEHEIQFVSCDSS